MPTEIVTRLLAEMTAAEKLSLLHQWAPAVPRLELVAFRTGSEALHGVAWLGEATVFPQPVGLAATWDPELLEHVGTAVASELLAKHHADPEQVSRNVWAPVVDPLRHPRWGRNEEGYSEDPHLTAVMATGYAQGLRGRDPHRWLTVPTLKHLLAYNVETDRAVRSMQVSPRVLHEYELPAFAGPLAAGVAGAVMPAYNLVNGRPCHISGELLDLVRACAHEEILVVSDAGAPSNLVRMERVHADDADAWAAALLAGVDSFTDHDADAGPTTAALEEALARGTITQADIDRAAARSLLTRARLGELDDESAPPRPTPDLDAHHALAEEVARRGVVLLENDGLLPLSRDPRSVVVVGPLADRVLPDWYAGTPTRSVTVADAVRRRWPGAAVEVVDGADRILLRPLDGDWLREEPGGAIVAAAGPTGDAAAFDVTDWGEGVLTIASAATSALWTLASHERVLATAARPHGWVVQESFRRVVHPDGTCSFRHLGSGRWLRVDASGALVVGDHDLQAADRFEQRVVRVGTAAVAAAAAAADLTLCALGNDPHLLGRETQDRPGIALPSSMVAIWESAAAACDDAVLALISSYPYGLDVDARAVLWSAHSQAQGTAVVDVVAGDVEPTGRLAQTWWADDDQAGELGDYDIIGSRSTYWYSPHAPRYPFGHGLTYSRIDYLALEVDTQALRAVVTVRNSGDREATEVVQVYTDAIEHRSVFPHRLAGFARVTLKPGRSRTVQIDLPRDRFAIWDTARDALVVDPGRYRVSAGPDAVHAPVAAVITLDGEAPVPHRLPLRAVAFDSAEHARLVPETLERGTAVAGDGAVLLFRAVAGLEAPLAVRVARAAPGPARVDLQRRVEGTWSTVATASVPTEAHTWTTVPATPVGEGSALPTDALRVILVGGVRLAEITAAPPTSAG